MSDTPFEISTLSTSVGGATVSDGVSDASAVLLIPAIKFEGKGTSAIGFSPPTSPNASDIESPPDPGTDAGVAAGMVCGACKRVAVGIGTGTGVGAGAGDEVASCGGWETADGIGD